ncbi:MAG TPA: type II secretion system protein GspJ [Aestuariivirgaceae bacterium]
MAGTQGNASGFTILEMLVVLCILGLLFTYALQMIQQLRRMDSMLHQIEKRSSIDAIRHHLQTVVSAARPMVEAAGGQYSRVAFRGEASQVQLVIASDGTLEKGGLLLVQIATRGRSDGLSDLVTRRTAYGSDGRSGRGEVVLLEQIKSFRLRYYGQSGGDRMLRWHDQWNNQAGLPRLVEIAMVMSEKGRWSQVRWIMQPAVSGP